MLREKSYQFDEKFRLAYLLRLAGQPAAASAPRALPVPPPVGLRLLLARHVADFSRWLARHVSWLVTSASL